MTKFFFCWASSAELICFPFLWPFHLPAAPSARTSAAFWQCDELLLLQPGTYCLSSTDQLIAGLLTDWLPCKLPNVSWKRAKVISEQKRVRWFTHLLDKVTQGFMPGGFMLDTWHSDKWPKNTQRKDAYLTAVTLHMEIPIQRHYTDSLLLARCRHYWLMAYTAARSKLPVKKNREKLRTVTDDAAQTKTL